MSTYDDYLNKLRNIASDNIFEGDLEFIKVDALTYQLNMLEGIYEANIDCGRDVADSFFRIGEGFIGEETTLLWGPPQSGKTNSSAVGLVIVLDRLMRAGIDLSLVDVIVGLNLNSNTLKEQNMEKFEDIGIESYGCTYDSGHLFNYPNITKSIKGRKGQGRICIAAFDEVQYSNNEGGYYHSILDAIKDTYNISRILTMSATPYNYVGNDYINKNANESYNYVIYTPASTYVGAVEMKDRGVLHQVQPCIKTNPDTGNFYATPFLIDLIKEYVADFESGNEGNFTIRFRGDDRVECWEQCVHQVMKSLGYKRNQYRLEDLSAKANKGVSKFHKINKFPAKGQPRFLNLRGDAVAGQTITNKLATTYAIETSINPNVDTSYQGLPGRFMGHNAPLDHIKIYTDLDNLDIAMKFDDDIINAQDSIDYAPGTSHITTTAKIDIQYKVEFEPYTKELASRLDKEEVALRSQTKGLRVKHRSSGVTAKTPSVELYNRLTKFAESTLDSKDKYVLANRAPFSLSRTEPLYCILDGIGDTDTDADYFDLAYQTIMLNLIRNGVRDIHGNILRRTGHYVIRVKRTRNKITFNSLQPPDLGDKLSKNVTTFNKKEEASTGISELVTVDSTFKLKDSKFFNSLNNI